MLSALSPAHVQSTDDRAHSILPSSGKARTAFAALILLADQPRHRRCFDHLGVDRVTSIPPWGAGGDFERTVLENVRDMGHFFEE